ncbi:MAG: membrane protein insertase YidC [Clostridia bacterium]|nr:membrane protein insertase YidC [Clostridia bacterium]
MNKKTVKILKKIALMVLIIAALAMVLSSCSSNTIIDTSKTPEQWKDTTVNTGASTQFIDVILSGIGTFLGWITLIMPANSYILTLFVFGIILEIVMLPFGIKQQKNSIKQAKLRPKEMAIRKKYAGRNDQATQQKVTQEIQELYQKENFNPMGGCLPLLLQLPIVMVLYWIVVDPIQYVCHMGRDVVSVLYSFMTTAVDKGGLGLALKSTNGSIEIFSKIKDLGPEAFEGIKNFCANGSDVYDKIVEIDRMPANFNIGPINFGLTPTFDFTTVNAWLLVLPVLTFLVYFFSMKITRKFTYQPTQNTEDRQQACSTKMMDYTMPLMSVWMTFIVPAAVGVYWLFKSILGTIKQIIMSKAMPLPVFTEEDYKAAEKEYAGKQPKKIQKSANAGKVRSLHHIDDDDYDEQGNYIGDTHKDEPDEEVPVAEEKIADNKMTEGAALKDESDKGEEKRGLFGRKKKKD